MTIEEIYKYLTENLSTNIAKLWVYDSLDVLIELMNDKISED